MNEWMEIGKLNENLCYGFNPKKSTEKEIIMKTKSWEYPCQAIDFKWIAQKWRKKAKNSYNKAEAISSEYYIYTHITTDVFHIVYHNN